MPLPPGFVPEGQPPRPARVRPVVPPHVKQSHVTIPRDRLKAVGRLGAGALVLLGVFVGGIGLGTATMHWPHPAPVPVPVPPKPDGPLRVILVVDNGANLNAGQLNALASTKVRSWLDDHCGKDDEGRPAWRQWDPAIDVANEAKDWQDVWSDVKGSVGTPPQVVILRGKKGKAYPLPDSPDALIKLLEGK